MSAVELRDVVKAYGAVPVIHGVNLGVADGEFLVLVGPVGLRQVDAAPDGRRARGHLGRDGLDRRQGGQRPGAEGAEHRDGVPELRALPAHDGGREHGLLAAAAPACRATEMRAKVDRAAGILGLGELLDRYPAQLSGGQRQRVAMGRAIVRNPEVFLFDEPLSNLDAKLRVQMRTEIGELHQRLRTTTIYVTHDQVEAMTMADRIVVMNGGRVEQVGSPLELYDTPRNLFVAGFIGSPAMNLLPGRVAGGPVRLGGGHHRAAAARAAAARRHRGGRRHPARPAAARRGRARGPRSRWSSRPGAETLVVLQGRRGRMSTR